MSNDPLPSPAEGATQIPSPVPAKGRAWRLAVTSLLVVGAVLLLLRACGSDQPQSVSVVAAGDMACDPKDPAMTRGRDCQAQAVSDIAVGLDPYAFIGLGDYQYEIPTADGYTNVYDPGWGRLRDITFPAIGNQEYKVHEANTFHNYFAERSGPDQGYWSVDIAQWHVVFLNSNCTVVTGGCAAGSPQHQWLQADLMDADQKCTMAVWHHPRWSNGIAGSDARMAALYDTLLVEDVDLLLSGHEADYERFGPLDSRGRAAPEGVRQFVVGTGGQVTYDPAVGYANWRSKAKAVPSEFRDTDHHGVLQLRLDPDSYAWQFFALGEGVVDAGSADCH